MRLRFVAVVVGIVTAACSGTAPTTPSADGSTGAAVASPSAASSAATSPSAGSPSAGISGLFPVDGHDMHIECQGEGSPTVVLEAGLSGASSAWLQVTPGLAATTRVCAYDRAGLGSSRQRDGNPPTSVGAMAGELWKLLHVAHIEGPYVLVGHSFGGMIIRVVAHEHPDDVRGLVLVDSASVHQFEGDWLKNDGDWFDGGPVDRMTSAKDLAAVRASARDLRSSSSPRVS